MVRSMEKEIISKSFLSIICKFFIRISGFKNNTISIKETKKHIDRINNRKYQFPKKYNYIQKQIAKSEVYTNDNNLDKNDTIMVYVHGGSYIEHAMKLQLNFFDKLATYSSSSLVIPIYDLIPKGNCKKLMNEMLELYKELLDKNKKIILVGDSAGAGFILSFTLLLKDNKIKLPESLIMFSPWLDLSLNNPKIIEMEKKDIVCSIEGNKYCGNLWANDLDINDYRVSPINGDFSNMPRMFITVGGNDLCQPDCKILLKKLKKAKVKYYYYEMINQFHNYQIYPTKESKIILKEAIKFVKEGQ